jgi:lysophospholipase L1-like esterase
MIRTLHDAIVIGIATSLLLEVGLRIHNPIYVPVRADGIRLPVNRVFRQTNVNNDKVDHDRVMTYNSIGFRGPDYPDRPDDYVKIFMVGGSTTACVFLTDGKTWPDIVGRTLSTHGDKSIWVNNAGFDGHSTFGHQILVTNHLSKFDADIIVFLVGINDVGREDLNNYDVEFTAHGETLRNRVVASSELLSTVQVLYRAYKAHDMGLNYAFDDDLTKLKHMEFSEAAVNAIVETHRTTHLPGYRARVKHLIETTRQLGAVPVFVTQPGLMGTGIDPTTGVELGPLQYRDQDVSAGVMWQTLELYNDVVRDLGRSENVPVIDAARTMPKDSHYYFDWIHYSNSGAERMASIIREGLQPIVDGLEASESSSRNETTTSALDRTAPR